MVVMMATVVMAAVVIASDVVLFAGEPDSFPFIRTFAAKLLRFGQSFCFGGISEFTLSSN